MREEGAHGGVREDARASNPSGSSGGEVSASAVPGGRRAHRNRGPESSSPQGELTHAPRRHWRLGAQRDVEHAPRRLVVEPP